MILGYAHPAMVERLRRAVEKPLSYGAQHEIEITVAEKIHSIVPCAERVAFTSSGSEAVQLAHRLARAFTGRPLILKFEGHYHGWIDSTLLSYQPQLRTGRAGRCAKRCSGIGEARWRMPPQITVVAPWNRLDVLEQILRAKQGKSRRDDDGAGALQQRLPHPLSGYLAAVRQLADRHGALLIFDEVITGFRLDTGGAGNSFGITPDLATFGKAVGGGVPLSVIAGRAEICSRCSPAASHSAVRSTGIHFRWPPPMYPRRTGARQRCDSRTRQRWAEKLMDGIRRLGSESRLAAAGDRLRHGVFSVHFTAREQLRDYRDTFDDDQQLLQRFLKGALSEGLNLVPDGRFYVSAAHGEPDIEETLDKLGTVFQGLTD